MEDEPARSVEVRDQLKTIKRLVGFRMVLDETTRAVRGSTRRRQRRRQLPSQEKVYQCELEIEVKPVRRGGLITLPRPQDLHGVVITYIIGQETRKMMPRFIFHDGRVLQVDGPQVVCQGRRMMLRWRSTEAKLITDGVSSAGPVTSAGERAAFIFESGVVQQLSSASYLLIIGGEPTFSELAVGVPITKIEPAPS